ncbi:MAG: hypothetical protein HQL86_05960 [Magnetococcales bacterium]|nr:hypothetical protein [Magnetococcales bacterium]
MSKASKRSGMVCKNEHDTLLAIKVALLTQISRESAFSHRVFWLFDNLPNLHELDFKSKKCEKCKGSDCDTFKNLRRIRKLVSDPKTVETGIADLVRVYQLPPIPMVSKAS